MSWEKIKNSELVTKLTEFVMRLLGEEKGNNSGIYVNFDKVEDSVVNVNISNGEKIKKEVKEKKKENNKKNKQSNSQKPIHKKLPSGSENTKEPKHTEDKDKDKEVVKGNCILGIFVIIVLGLLACFFPFYGKEQNNKEKKEAMVGRDTEERADSEYNREEVSRKSDTLEPIAGDEGEKELENRPDRALIEAEEERSTEEPPVNVDEISDANNSTDEEPDTFDYSLDWNLDVALIKTEEIETFSFEMYEEQCELTFKAMNGERMAEVELAEKMPKEYRQYVIEANEIYEEYDTYADYEEKQDVLSRAGDKRDDAKKEYRHTSNEQIAGNYYAKRGLNSYNNGLSDMEFKNFRNAIDSYYDAYAVSCKNDEPRNIILEYIATCFYNISKMEELDAVTREQAALSAITMFKKYSEAPDAPQLKTNLNIGRAYTNLCVMQEEDEAEFYYFDKAVSYFEKCYNDPKCQEKMSPIVYDELIFMYQYCYDHISQDVYPEEITKNYIKLEHRKYVELRKRYDN